MTHLNTVLILQGGGALGAYQAGVYQQLHENHGPIEWVIGTSIGAINAALIAGNPPEFRLSRLKGFWDSLAPQESPAFLGWWSGMGSWGKATPSMNMLGILIDGVKGFFQPRFGASWDINAKVPLSELGFYDTSPLKTTLEKFVDFDYLNSGPMRISVCAVDIDSGQGVIFDSKKQKIHPEHIMASGALPPGFPPIEIDGHAYWDGGVYSNSPLEVFLDEAGNRDALCFMIDLWDPTEARPESIAEAMTRYKSIQYASRSIEQLAEHKKIQDLRSAIRALADNLTPAARDKATLRPLIRLGRDHTVNLVHLIMKAVPGDEYFKDVDFSVETVDARWRAGILDCKRALHHKAWLRPLPPHAGLVVHELPQE